MFQRRMLLVASRLRNVQLSRPGQLRRASQTTPPQREEEQKHDHENLFQSLRLSAESKRARAKARFQANFLYLSFGIYLLGGTLFYKFDRNNQLNGILAFYESITIGFSVGLSPKDPNYA